MAPDFRSTRKTAASNAWYDPKYDAVLIEQSIATQYGVLPSDQGNLSYSDWAKMVSGLRDNTPLGRVVSIRMENDRDVISRMSPEQIKIRNDWSEFKIRKFGDAMSPNLQSEMDKLQQKMMQIFGGG